MFEIIRAWLSLRSPIRDGSKAFHPLVLGALLTVLATAAQALPVSITPSSGGPNITSAGKNYTYAVILPEAIDGESPQALLSLSFKVSNNPAAQNDTIRLFIGEDEIASGLAASFDVTNLDVTNFFDFTTGTVTFKLVRDVTRGGGTIQLRRVALRVGDGSSGGQASGGPAVESEPNLLFPRFEAGDVSPQQVVFQVPEPGTLALLGLGIFGIGFMRRRATRVAGSH